MEERLDWWSKQKEHELIHAKFTNPDSYYIYNLLRLVQAKDDAVQQSVLDVKAEWADLAIAESEELAEF